MRSLALPVSIVWSMLLVFSVAEFAAAQESESRSEMASLNVEMTFSIPVPLGWTQHDHATDLKLVEDATSASTIPTYMTLRPLRFFGGESGASVLDEIRGQASQMLATLVQQLSEVGQILGAQVLPDNPSTPDILYAVEIRLQVMEDGSPVVFVIRGMSVAASFDSVFSLVVSGAPDVDLSAIAALGLELLGQLEMTRD